ncbi:MAG: hypothetical protein VX494_04345 [Actinomycetota bacterium]|nr:hypothetical protein [Actinomycetota bacterium]
MPLIRPRAQRDPSPMAARARSALACPAGADLRGHDDTPLIDLEVVSLADDAGRPTLLYTPTSPLLTQASRRDVVRLRVTSGVRGTTGREDDALDVLEVSGRLVLGGSEGCGQCPDEHRLVVLEPAAVTLRVRGRTVPVPVEDFLGADHALNRGYLQRAAEHATACHGEELRRVVARLTGCPPGRLAAASLAELAPDGVELRWVDLDGAHARRLHFDPPASDTASLGRLLREHLDPGIC